MYLIIIQEILFHLQLKYILEERSLRLNILMRREAPVMKNKPVDDTSKGCWNENVTVLN
jgi:hypothetical protein